MTNKEYSDRLHWVIPGGSHTYSRGDDQFPSNAPAVLERAKGARVWDPNGNRFLDYGMGLRSVTLGYANERVNQAAIAEIVKGVNLTRASVTELHAAETLVDLIPAAEMVKFAKNGSNVTSAAVKLARANTGRSLICVPRQQPFFSFDDWFIGTTAIKRGIPPEAYAHTLVFDYGDIASLEALFEKYPDQIAGVFLEPATTLAPCEGKLTVDGPEQKGENFLHKVQALCRKNGSLFMLDEMITGFRWHLGGAQTYFGVEPDISTFGKAMANGFSVAALAGRREVMEAGAIRTTGMERTFLLSSTNGSEMPGLGAFLEAVRIHKEEPVIAHHWSYGQKLFDGLQKVSASHGLEKHFIMDGSAIAMNYLTRDRDGQLSPALRTVFHQEMVRQGILIPWVAVSIAHTQEELDFTLQAADVALKVFGQAVEEGTEKYLEGPAVKPVFRQFN